MMANIFKRLFFIGKSEVHALLDKMQNTTKTLNQSIREMEKNFEEMKKAVAQQIAYEKSIGKKVENADSEVMRLANLAKSAVENGNDHDARIHLMDKKREEERREQYKALLHTAKADTKSFRERLIALQTQLDTMKSKRDYLVTRHQFVKNNLDLEKRMSGSSYDISLESLQQEIDEIEALTSINRELKKNDATSSPSYEVDQELEQLKNSVSKPLGVKE